MIYTKQVTIDNNKFIKYELINARVLRLLTNGLVTETLIGDKLNSISIFNTENDSVLINRDGYVDVKLDTLNTRYDVDNIVKERAKCYTITTCKSSKSRQFLLPALGSTAQFFKTNTFLENVYIDSTNPKTSHIPRGQVLYCLYRFFDCKEFQEMERNFQRSPLYVDAVDVDDYHILYVFEVLEHFKPNIEIFKLGKYSEFTSSFKEQILTFHGFSKEGETAQILYKDSKRKKQLEMEFDIRIHEELELYSKPELIEETYF
jgi:hypothetical protein